jgi:hypothetical protein
MCTSMGDSWRASASDEGRTCIPAASITTLLPSILHNVTFPYRRFCVCALLTPWRHLDIGRTLSDRLCITTPPAQQPSPEVRGFQTEATRHLPDQQHLRSNEAAAASLGQPTPLELPHAHQFDSQFDIYDNVEKLRCRQNFAKHASRHANKRRVFSNL